LEKDTANDLVCKLLVENSFQIGRVDEILFNLVGLASFYPEKNGLSTSDKQDIYLTSRAPLKALFDQLRPLTDRLEMIQWDIDTKEYKNISKRVQKLQEKIKATQLSVSNDVFERINSCGSMGIIGYDGLMSIDLHALHVEEAKNMLLEYVFPVLPVVRKVLVITGRGTNSNGGKGVMKEEIKVYECRL
jgi:hypothetical protein